MVDETLTSTGGTDLIAIILLSLIGVVLIAILIYIIVMFKRRYINQRVKFNIIYKDGSVDHKFIKNPEKTEVIFKKRYFFKKEALIRKKYGQEIWYRDGIKEPIIFNDVKYSSPVVVPVSAEEFDIIVKEELSKKLIGGDLLSKTDIMIIIVIVMLGLSLFMLYNISNGGVTLNNDGLLLIRDSFRSVINGG